MRLFRRRRPEPSGVLRRGDHSEDAADYAVFTVGENRFPETFAELRPQATAPVDGVARLRQRATLVPVRDPQFGVAEVRVEFDGMAAGYLRPPHLGLVAADLEAANAVAMDVPALVEWGPAGPTVTLIIAGRG